MLNYDLVIEKIAGRILFDSFWIILFGGILIFNLVMLRKVRKKYKEKKILD